MLRAVLADLHLGQEVGDVARFAAVADELADAGVEELVLLGDCFRTLVGYRKFWGAGVRHGLEVLGTLRERGVRVVMIEGNRDFFLDSRDLDPYRDLACAAHSFAAGGRRFLLEHGDLVNRRDRSYRAWRALSKSRTARLWAWLLPERLAVRIVSRTEQRLSRTNFAYRQALPEDDLAAAAGRHFAAGVDVVLWGHFHKPWRLVDGDREARVVAAWAEARTVLQVARDGHISESASSV